MPLNILRQNDNDAKKGFKLIQLKPKLLKINKIKAGGESVLFITNSV